MTYAVVRSCSPGGSFWWDNPASSAVFGLMVLIIRLFSAGVKRVPDADALSLDALVKKRPEELVVAIGSMALVANSDIVQPQRALPIAAGVFLYLFPAVVHVWRVRQSLERELARGTSPRP